MLRLTITLICEGSSDAALLQHLEALCVKHGADEVMGVYPDLELLRDKLGKGLAPKIRAALRLEPNTDILFIHRDSDSRDPEPRYQEIEAAVNAVEPGRRYVAVVPVQETEAWLLVDESAIREVAENPSGRIDLGLPRIRRIEQKAKPKEFLLNVILNASEASGRRLRLMRDEFPNKRRQLIDRIDIDGNINQVDSWRRLANDVQASIMMQEE